MNSRHLEFNNTFVQHAPAEKLANRKPDPLNETLLGVKLINVQCTPFDEI